MTSSGIQPTAFRLCNIVYVVNFNNDVRTKFAKDWFWNSDFDGERMNTHTGLLSHKSEPN
jgi:hypothetical protein